MLHALLSFLFLLIASSDSNSNNGSAPVDEKLRSGGGAASRDPDLVHKTYVEEGSTSKYGDGLPSFAYDFSELFLGAVIERSLDSDDLHLSIVLLGKKTIHLQDESISPFKSVSTDINTIEMWTKASDSSSWWTTQSHTSPGLTCRLQNDATKSTYLTAASSLPSDSFVDAKHNGMIEVLRCKIKHVRHAYKVLSSSDSFLHVDIVRRHSLKEQGQNLISFAGRYTSYLIYSLVTINAYLHDSNRPVVLTSNSPKSHGGLDTQVMDSTSPMVQHYLTHGSFTRRKENYRISCSYPLYLM